MFAKNVLGILFVFMLFNSNTYASSSCIDLDKTVICSASDETVTAADEWLRSDLNLSSLIPILKNDKYISLKLESLSFVNQTFDEKIYNSLLENLAIRISEDVIKFRLTVRDVIEEFLY
jgi:hypothetical protein